MPFEIFIEINEIFFQILGMWEGTDGDLEKKIKSVYLLAVRPGILKYCIFISVALKQQVVNVCKYSHKQLEGFIQAIFIVIS